MNMFDKQHENAIEYWYPKIKNLSVPTPATEIIPLKWDWAENGNDIIVDKSCMVEIIEKARIMGYPLFVRGSDGSGKHDWKDTCYVEKEADMEKHINNLIMWALSCDIIGIPCTSIALREFIQMDSGFCAFMGMPVNPERRYFIKDGEILCHHPYWVEDAIWGRNLPDNWKEILKEMNEETAGEINHLSSYTKKVAALFPGSWSVDFCRAKDGKWHLIDMALFSDSWHPDCPNKPARRESLI